VGEKSEFVPLRVKWMLDLVPQGEIICIPDKHLVIYKVSQAEIERLEEFWTKNRMGDYARGYLNGKKRGRGQAVPEALPEDEREMSLAEAARLLAQKELNSEESNSRPKRTRGRGRYRSTDIESETDSRQPAEDSLEEMEYDGEG